MLNLNAETIILILYSNGALNSLFTALIVITISGANFKSNKYFSILLAVISLSYFYVLFLPAEVTTTIPYFFGGMHKSAFIFGPALYMYFMSIVRKRFRFDAKKMLHFLPFLIYTALMMPLYLSSNNEKITLYTKYMPYLRPVFFLIFLHFISYMLYTFFFIRSNGVVILKKFKNIESVAINWFKYLSLMSLGTGCFCCIMYIFYLTFNYSPLILNTVTDFILFLLLHILAYRGIRKIEILQYIPGGVISGKYEKSGMSMLQAENYTEAVIQYVERERNYLNSELSLKILSSALSISEHHLSQVFSQFLKKTFSDYINGLRINEAKVLIKNLPSDYPIVRIAFDAGFNSKSSFNLNFKRITGLTPSQFRYMKDSGEF